MCFDISNVCKGPGRRHGASFNNFLCFEISNQLNEGRHGASFNNFLCFDISNVCKGPGRRHGSSFNNFAFSYIVASNV
uniref:Uncharacterized protein n=1 Tax=Globodera rostochiensis TaxID=31243 RepID=A0A914I0F7_GLORO